MTLTNGGRRNVPFTGGVGGHGFFPSAIPERYRPGAWPSQGRGHRGGVCTAAAFVPLGVDPDSEAVFTL